MPLSNRAWTYFNECVSFPFVVFPGFLFGPYTDYRTWQPGGSGGDDGAVSNPNLPVLGGGGGGGDYGNINDCKVDQTFSRIEDIPKSGPLICRIYYALEILYNYLDEALNSYDTLISNDYNKKFDIYAKDTVAQADDALDDKAENHGNEYFDCEVVEKIVCCSGCANLHPEQECLYCADDGEACNYDGFFPGTMEKAVYEKTPEPCPPDFSK